MSPPGTQSVYITGFIAGTVGVGGHTKSVIAIDTTNLADSGVVHWLAPIGDVAGLAYGSAIPAVTLPGDAGPGLVFASGLFANTAGDVSLVRP